MAEPIRFLVWGHGGNDAGYIRNVRHHIQQKFHRINRFDVATEFESFIRGEDVADRIKAGQTPVPFHAIYFDDGGGKHRSKVVGDASIIGEALSDCLDIPVFISSTKVEHLQLVESAFRGWGCATGWGFLRQL